MSNKCQKKKAVGKKYMQITAAMSGSGQNVNTYISNLYSSVKKMTSNLKKKLPLNLKALDFWVINFFLIVSG